MSGWLIWSNEHAMWWGPDERGYTAVIEGAGVYPEAEAKRIVADASLDGQLVVDRVDSLGQRRRVPPEVAVPSPWASWTAEEMGT